MERKRLVADRFRRIWAIIEHISAQPGCSRRDLAQRFALSERQLQADLNVIRVEMGLPLVRREGYRFLPPEDSPTARFGLADAHLLSVALYRTAADGAAPPEAVRALAAKLPDYFPPHLRLLLRRALAPVVGEPAEPAQAQVFGVLAIAMERGAPVRLRYRSGRGPGLLFEPVVDPELVLPYLGCWYLIGQCHQQRKVMMFCLDTVTEVCLATPAATAT
jgi:predicted DNA-binding transcriptional regulator YafY